MRIKQDLPTYNASINLRTDCTMVAPEMVILINWYRNP